jgi:hypothetical protein
VALIATQQISQAGTQPSLQAASAGGDTYEPTANTVLFVKNGDSVQHTVTIHTTATAYGQPISNIAVPIPAGAEVLLGPYEPGEVANPATALASVTYDAVTNLSIAALEV